MTSPRRPGRHLVVVGPTASGKSALAVALARHRIATGSPTEIVSCDSMAVYRGMDIGTATPTIADRQGVRHHLLDVVDPSEEFSVQRFVGLVDAALDDIESRAAAAVLVGGTGLYVQAVVDGFRLPGRYPEALADLDRRPTDELERRLAELDPVAAGRVPPGNRRRLLRALEVTIGSGRPFSSHGPGLTTYGPTPFVLTGLAVPRQELRDRIGARYEQQLADGLLDEVRRLASRPEGISRTAAEALGYRELLAYVRSGAGSTDVTEGVESAGRANPADQVADPAGLDAAIALAVQRTRRFAVRQERWFRRDPRITWFDASGAGIPADSGPVTGATRPADATGPAGAIDRHWRELDADAAGRPTTVDPSCCG